MKQIKFWNGTFPVGMVTVGRVVQYSTKEQYGHILGFGLNYKEDLMLDIRWDTGDECIMDPADLILHSS